MRQGSRRVFTTRYHGVMRRQQGWVVSIRIYLGPFKNAEDAALARDRVLLGLKAVARGLPGDASNTDGIMARCRSFRTGPWTAGQRYTRPEGAPHPRHVVRSERSPAQRETV